MAQIGLSLTVSAVADLVSAELVGIKSITLQPCQKVRARSEPQHEACATVFQSTRVPARLAGPWKALLIRLRYGSCYDFYSCLAVVNLIGFCI